MDGMRFRSPCANVDRLSLGQLRELRRKLREPDARREVLARLDATRGPKVIRAAFRTQTVNNLHSRFGVFIRPFCGPATKYLPAYIAWFIARLADRHSAHDEAWRKILAA